MKRIIVLILAIAPCTSFAAAPSTSCPSGYTAVFEEHMDIANSSCPSGYSSAGTATSCIASNPGGSCIMYAPANTTYSDNTGSYVFEQACAME
ncbi:MAG: hypothetical protein IAC77_00060 [Proteobacteria bacterium]|uniref:Uncharacterized protein n=1 Tax=Candidatus Enterousia excrementavium TaxID=2840789 RepID=A0A940DEX1_9PROT|nr:hypothetical protein [Candidatus Enterousia excrementavium]